MRQKQNTHNCIVHKKKKTTASVHTIYRILECLLIYSFDYNYLCLNNIDDINTIFISILLVDFPLFVQILHILVQENVQLPKMNFTAIERIA